MPISPYMDRNNPQLAKLQESFINHLVAPLCNAYGEAGLLPGEWDDGVQDDDDESLPSSFYSDESGCHDDRRASSGESSCLTELDRDIEPSAGSGSDSDTPVHRKRSPTGRKILCLQTQHLQENHQYWVTQIKVIFLQCCFLNVLNFIQCPFFFYRRVNFGHLLIARVYRVLVEVDPVKNLVTIIAQVIPVQ